MDEEKKDILDFFFDGDIIIAGAQGYTNISKILETGNYMFATNECESDLNVFFMRLQEQDDEVASWADSTIQKIKRVLNRILIENEYITEIDAQYINVREIYDHEFAKFVRQLPRGNDEAEARFRKQMGSK